MSLGAIRLGGSCCFTIGQWGLVSYPSGAKPVRFSFDLADDAVVARTRPSAGSSRVASRRVSQVASLVMPVAYNPDASGYCYLRWFPAAEWMRVAKELGPFPVLAKVLGFDGFDRSKLSDMYVSEEAGLLHVVEKSDPGARIIGSVCEPRTARLHAMAVAGQEPVVVCIDPVGPDNFLMVAQVLKDTQQHVAVVLHDRPVDLSVEQVNVVEIAASDLFVDCDRGAVMRCLVSGGRDDPCGMWSRLPWRLREKLARRSGYESEAVVEDTELYLCVSAVRLALFLDALFVPRSRYTIYGPYRGSFADLNVPMVHACHPEDYFMSYPGYDEYEKQLREWEQSGGGPVALRALRRHHLERYLEMVRGRYFTDLTALFSALYGVEIPVVFSSGPLTYVYGLARVANVHNVGAMAGMVDGRVMSPFGQSNIGVNVDAAVRLIRMAVAGHINLTLVPIDAVCGRSEVAFTLAQLRALDGGSWSSMSALYAGVQGDLYIHAWLAYKAMCGMVPVEAVRVRVEPGDEEDQDGGLSYHLAEDDTSAAIVMRTVAGGFDTASLLGDASSLVLTNGMLV